MHDFHGWTAGALWDDLKFNFKNWKDIERLAMVGFPTTGITNPIKRTDANVCTIGNQAEAGEAMSMH